MVSDFLEQIQQIHILYARPVPIRVRGKHLRKPYILFFSLSGETGHQRSQVKDPLLYYQLYTRIA